MRRTVLRFVAVSLTSAVLCEGVLAQSSDTDSKDIQALEKQIAELKARLDRLVPKDPAQPSQPVAIAAAAQPGATSATTRSDPPAGARERATRPEDAPSNPAARSEAKAPTAPHKPFDFTVYGRINVSFDVGNQELKTAPCITSATSPCSPPQGDLRWLPDVASNLSRFGVRGYHDLNGQRYQAVFQLEAQVDVAATPGSKPNGSNDQINPGNSAVLGALASRNSFVGVSTPLGALKAGKNDTPYKTVTADFDFLAETPGDYNSIMGNTGGDNRAEFDARLPHALWYESPSLYGARVNAIWSPGQNRFEDNIGFAIGENVCAGGNAGPCNDGSFGDAFGFSGEWSGDGLKAIVSYEMHRKTNRTGDAGQTTSFGTSDVGTENEYAWKLGAKYTFAPSQTTVSGIFEAMRRDDVRTFNERQRNGFFFSALQKLDRDDELMGSWAHAGTTPGDPGTGPISNAANMLAAGYRHWFNRQTAVILSYAHLWNQFGAHYALGPSGHGVTWDCKDGGGPAAVSAGPGIGLEGNGTGCFTGTKPQAFSLGMTYDF